MDSLKALIKAVNGFTQFLPVLISILLLISLASTLITPRQFKVFFTGNSLTDPFIGAILGSVAAGNTITSYVIAGELKSVGVSLLSVTAFILAWVTVGIVQSPVEATALGWRFTLVRNIASFVSAILIAVLTVSTLSLT
jgi:uncharacterized membrane protein YraQ (UPF0718 family)